MANKRMFSKQITTSDAFVDMPMSSQLLYFHLCMEADDDGFVANPKRIIRVVGSNDDDLKILIAKRFLLSFEGGLVVIKHWHLHNAIRRDMYVPTQYTEEKSMLKLKDNKVYTELRNDSVTVPSHRLDKIRLDKNRLIDMSSKEDAFNQFWNAYPKKELKKKSQEIWKRKKLDSSLGVILEFITAAQKTDRWKKGFIKQPPAFLNGECWNDDVSTYNDRVGSQGKSVAIIQ